MVFTFETEHSVPASGFLKVTLPVEMAFPKAMVESQKPIYTLSKKVVGVESVDAAQFVNVTSEFILFAFEVEHNHLVDNPITLTLEKVRTPRSFRPSSEFLIETMSVEGFVIDAGGSDITVTMS